MTADRFLDTNVIVYAFDHSAPRKRERALEIMAGRDWLVSWQVIQEFCSVALHRFEVPLRSEDLRDYVDLKLWPSCRVLPSRQILLKALEVQRSCGFRFYDSLIVASALAGEARTLLSEDFQHGQQIGPLRIINPFLS